MSVDMLAEKNASPVSGSESPIKPTHTSADRVHYLDNLRATAMMLGVLLHAGLAYAHPAQSIWIATDPSSSVTIDASIWLIHLFRMGLFFLLSGYFAKLVIERKGTRKFLWNRFVRIVVPFVLFYPFLLAGMTVVFVFALQYLEEPRGLMGMIAAASKGATGPAEPPPLTTMHLWFLYYLAFFSAIGALWSGWKPRMPEFLARIWGLWWLAPMVLVPAVLKAGAPLPAPESFVPQWWPFVFYGSFFAMGWRLFGRESILKSCQPYAWPLLAVSGLLYVPYYFLMPVIDVNGMTLSELAAIGSRPIRWQEWVVAILTAYLSVSLTLGSLLLGQRYMSQRNLWLRFFSDSSYWVYLIHLPIVLFLQTLLIPMEWPLIVKLSVVILGTMISCLATYVVFVRYTPVGWMLHGKREFP